MESRLETLKQYRSHIEQNNATIKNLVRRDVSYLHNRGFYASNCHHYHASPYRVTLKYSVNATNAKPSVW